MQNRSGSGTITHLAPEVLHAGSKLTAAVDAYAFAVLAYEVRARGARVGCEPPPSGPLCTPLSAPLCAPHTAKNTHTHTHTRPAPPPTPPPQLYTGNRAFHGLRQDKVVECVTQRGIRPMLPADAPGPLAALVNACWAADPGRRPVFSAISARLREMLADIEAAEEEAAQLPPAAAGAADTAAPGRGGGRPRSGGGGGGSGSVRGGGGGGGGGSVRGGGGSARSAGTGDGSCGGRVGGGGGSSDAKPSSGSGDLTSRGGPMDSCGSLAAPAHRSGCSSSGVSAAAAPDTPCAGKAAVLLPARSSSDVAAWRATARGDAAPPSDQLAACKI